MLDADTFLTTLYVMVDDFCKAKLPAEVQPGPKASLSRSEVVTLALFGQWGRFASERDFFRFAQQRLRAAFPTLPNRTQFNRLLRRHQAAIVAFDLSLREETDLELLDLSAAPVRDRRRRGRSWVAGKADYGYSSREGTFPVFTCSCPSVPKASFAGSPSGQAPPRNRRWRSASSPCVIAPIHACRAWARSRRGITWRIGALPAANCMRGGSRTTGRACSPWCRVGIRSNYPSGGTSAWSASARSSRRFTRSSIMFSGSSESDPTRWTVSLPGWPPRWACTTSASGSIAPWDAHPCSSQTYWTGSI